VWADRSFWPSVLVTHFNKSGKILMTDASTLICRADQLDVIVVGAHPDDVEIGVGGTVASLVDLGYKVGIIDLTDGEPTPNSPGPHVRLEEARAAGEVLGVHLRKILPLKNRRLMDGFEERVALATEFRRYKPQMVIGLGGKTPLASPDHYQAVQIVDAAIFYSRLTKWDEHFSGLAVHSITKQLYYRLQFEPAFGGENFITVDISKQLDRKMDSIGCYKTQFPPEKSYVFERVRALAMASGAAIGVHAGEVLSSVRPIGTSDLGQAMGLHLA
jgi:LmbE family N-acetylglucosaminyl deacetylase